MERKTAILILLSWLCLLHVSAHVIDAGFIKPMDLPFNLAGSFGEPRPDHFHSGIDIKTNEEEGYTVVAIGDGYVSRIRVSPYGYGKSIYITHPNGYTSVYGHLSGFNAELENYVHRQHYLKQQSELDLYPGSGQFKVKQGDTIAFSGNTGGSGGPHLHFEIRDSKTEHALNPLDFYPKDFYVDTIPPTVLWVTTYNITRWFYRNLGTYSTNLVKNGDQFVVPDPIFDKYDSTVIRNEKDRIKPIPDGYYYTTSQPLDIQTQLFGISISGYDKQDNSSNKNGIYKIRVTSANELLFQYTMNEVDFGKARMCNLFSPRNTSLTGDQYLCLKLPANTLPIYDSVINFGLVNTLSAIEHGLTIECYDYNLNKSVIKLNFTHKDTTWIVSPGFNQSDTGYYYNKFNDIQEKGFNLKFSRNSFYDDVIIIHRIKESNDPSILSDELEVSKGLYLPLQAAAKIAISAPQKSARDKIIIIRRDDQGEETALKTSFDKTHFYADTKELGTFYLKYDTIKPVIQVEGIDETGIRARISDARSGISSYNAYIDGQWVNFYYDAKNDRITYTYDEFCLPGEHKLKLVVTDAVGNSAIFTQTFKR